MPKLEISISEELGEKLEFVQSEKDDGTIVITIIERDNA